MTRRRIFLADAGARRRPMCMALLLTYSAVCRNAAAFTPNIPPSVIRPNTSNTHAAPTTTSSSTRLQQVASALPLLEDEGQPSASNAQLLQATEAVPAPPKVGVLLLNLGGPEKESDVEGFLYNLFADPDIIRLPPLLSPLQTLIAWFISKRRAPKSREAYASIGGGSPILQYSQQQADLLRQSCRDRYGVDVQSYIGMRYWHPFTEEALEQIRKDAIEALVILPLYPQFSISTSGSSLRVLQEEIAMSARSSSSNNNNVGRWNPNMVHTVVPSWYDRPGYVQAMASLLRRELDAFTEEQLAEAKAAAPNEKPLHVLFSAHGVPQSYIEAGDPYQRQIIDCVARISAAIVGDDSNDKSPYDHVEMHLSYQSRVGPIEWLRPYTDDVLPALGARGVRNLVVVPISFVSEHIETLEEIDIEYRELAEESGVTHWRRCPALNTDPAFIDDMADMVMEALQEPAQTVTEACVANMVVNIDDSGLLEDSPQLIVAGVQGVGGGGGGENSLLYQAGQRQLEQQERLVSRIAMAGVGLILLVEMINGRSLVDMLPSFQ